MAKQETHSGIPPIFRLVETMGGRIFRVLDWIAGCSAQDQDEDSARRCRLLVASTLVIFVFAQFFLYKVYASAGFMSPTAWVFVCDGQVVGILGIARDIKKTQSVEYLTQPIDRVLGSQRLSSGT